MQGVAYLIVFHLFLERSQDLVDFLLFLRELHTNIKMSRVNQDPKNFFNNNSNTSRNGIILFVEDSYYYVKFS